MQFDLNINNPVVVKSPGARLGQAGRVVDRFARTRALYAVQFDDGCIGYFERSELEKSAADETTPNRDKSNDFYDIAESITRP